MIDGGKGQLNAALAAMAEHDVARGAAIGLAKRLEEIYVPGRPAPIVLADDDPGLLLLRRIRDEAHRFALTHHRKRRSREASISLFDALPGVGPARRKALLRHFRTPERDPRRLCRGARGRARPADADRARDLRAPAPDGLRDGDHGARALRGPLRGARPGARGSWSTPTAC